MENIDTDELSEAPSAIVGLIPTLYANLETISRSLTEEEVEKLNAMIAAENDSTEEGV